MTLLLFVPLLSACDAWPTTVDNRSSDTIRFAYHDPDYDYWSAPFELSSGKATRLGREEYAEDIVGVRVSDAGHTYVMTPEGIARLHKICSRSHIDRALNLGGDCWITYHGAGRLTISSKEAPDIQYEQWTSSS